MKKIYGRLVCPLLLSCMVMVGLPTQSHAVFIKNLEFNIDGVLPSNDPDIGLSNNTGQSESTLYSVSGGLLQQRTLAFNGNASYGFPNGLPTGGGFSAADPFSMEARVQIQTIDGLGGAFFQALDGAHRYSVFYAPNAVNVLSTSGFQTFSIDLSEFHTYRIQSEGGTNAFEFYVDDVLTYSGFAAASGGSNGFNFGDGITDPGRGADANWDFVRYSQALPTAEVSAPGASFLFLAVAVLGRRLRRRNIA